MQKCWYFDAEMLTMNAEMLTMNAEKIVLHRIIRGSFRKIRIFQKKVANTDWFEPKKERFLPKKGQDHSIFYENTRNYVKKNKPNLVHCFIIIFSKKMESNKNL